MKDFNKGLKAGIPIGLGYLSVSFTFGMIAITYGLTWWQALLVSMTTVTSAGQFAGIKMMGLPGQSVPMLISQATINVRYSFMSVSLSQKLEKKFTGVYRWLLGFFMTDEIFAVASTEKVVTRLFFAGLAVIPYFGWSIGTLIGALLGGVMPHSLMSAFGLAIYGMFVAIVVPDMKKSVKVIVVVALAAAFSCLFYYLPALKQVSSGIAISVAAIVAALIGAALFPIQIEDDEEENEIRIENSVREVTENE